MKGIDMLSADIQRKQFEERREQRYQDRLADERQYNEEQQRKMGAQEEYGQLTKYIEDYKRNVTSGAEPDPDELKGVVGRRNELIKSGDVTPSIGMLQAPQAQEAEPMQMPEQQFFVPENVAGYFGFDPRTPLDQPTWRQLMTKYKDLTKPDKDGGTGIMLNFGGQKVPQNEVIERLDNFDKLARQRFEKGYKPEDLGSERKGIAREKYVEYLKELQDLKDAAEFGTWTPEHTKRYRNLKRFDVYLKEKENLDKGEEKLDKEFDLLFDFLQSE